MSCVLDLVFFRVFQCRPSRRPTARSVRITLLVFLAIVLLGCSCLPRHPYASALVLADVAAQDKPSRLKRTAPEPARQTVSYEIQGRLHQADLYRPGNTIRAGIILVPGAADTGKDDPRLVAFAGTLARAQFAVLVPDLVSLRRLELGQTNVHDLADAISYFSTRTELNGRLGIAAMSYAVGLAILAALEPRVEDKVQFIVGVGGYYDLAQVVTFFTTGFFRDCTNRESEWQFMEPNPYGKWVFILSHAGRIQNSFDRELLQRIARTKLENPAASIDRWADELGPEGRAYFALLTNQDPDRVLALLEGLPTPIKAEFDSLNLPRQDLSKLRAKLLLFHGRDDDIIPYTESVALAATAGKKAQLVLVRALAHVDVQGIGFRDRLRLWYGIDKILRERSRSRPKDHP